MTQNRVRLIVYVLWLVFLLVSIAAAELGPVIRNNGMIAPAEVRALLPEIIGVFLPALSCLGGFWFPAAGKKVGASKRLSRERGLLALIITGLYLCLVFSLIIWPIYFASYRGPGFDLRKEDSLIEQIHFAVRAAALLSPVALAPIHYLTSTET